MHMVDPIYMVRLDGRIIWVNRSFEELFGYTADYLHTHGLEFAPDYNQVEFEQAKIQYREKDTVSLYASRYTKDGQRIYCNLNMVPIRGESREVLAYSIILRNITIGTPTEQDERLMRLIAQHTTDTIIVVDNDAVVRYVSPSLYDLSGYHVEEYEGRPAFEVIHPDDRARLRQNHLHVLLTKESETIEYRILHKNGETVHAETRVVPVFDRNESMEYVIAVVRNITTRKKTEQLLHNVLDNVKAAVWSSDKEFTQIHALLGERLLGVSRSEAEPDPRRLHEKIHPDDVPLLMHEVGDSLRQGKARTITIRLLDETEGIKWLRMISQPILRNSGEVERIDGIFLDYTEQKKAEMALEESEQRYRSLFQNNLDGVFTIGLDGKIVNVNRSFETIAAMPASQLYRSDFPDLVATEDRDLVDGKLAEVIRFQDSRDVECRVDKFPCEEKILSITLVPIFRAGEISGVHGIVKDITGRKREEQELIMREERGKLLQQSLNRLSLDLANCMKVGDLKQRLLDEVKAMLPAAEAVVQEIPKGEAPYGPQGGERWLKLSEGRHAVFLRLVLTRELFPGEEDWLQTAVRYVTILYDNLHLIEDLMSRLEGMVAANETPRWMLRLLFKLSEKERFSLSSDLHDTVLQDLINWYRKLDSLRSLYAFEEEVLNELVRIEEGLLDAIHQLRITCNELRPPFLLKLGLVESMKSLLDYSKMFANYEILFDSEQYDTQLGEEELLCIYRVVQELLNNANKHSKASCVRIALSSDPAFVRFSYSDDGVGMDLSALDGSFEHMGLSGIEKRVQSLNGNLEIQSSPDRGFHLKLQLPLTSYMRREEHEHTHRG
ncbi:MAG TPA: PAS domain S-box protein [Bacilli bacterium]|nr:PAS domain S-box protein [Bacilli bacterium]